jgi:hypothetical protein
MMPSDEKEAGLVLGSMRGAVQRRRKILLVPPALRVRSARLNSKNHRSPPSGLKNRGGAPRGNHNALKHGKYIGEMRALRTAIRAHIREGQALIVWAKAIDLHFGRRRVYITEYIDIENGEVVSRTHRAEGSISVAERCGITREPCPTGCG